MIAGCYRWKNGDSVSFLRCRDFYSLEKVFLRENVLYAGGIRLNIIYGNGICKSDCEGKAEVEAGAEAKAFHHGDTEGTEKRMIFCFFVAPPFRVGI